MAKSLTDWSALNKVVVKPPEKPKTAPTPATKDEGEEVIEYFTKGAHGTDSAAAGEADDVGSGEIEAMQVALTEMAAEKAAAVERAEQAEMIAGSTQRKLDDLTRELERLKGDNARLRGEAARAAETARRAEDAKDDPLAETEPARPRTGLLAAPVDFDEAFDGELREMVVSALMDSLDTAKNGDRQRRATVLGAVLAANGSSGELERRRAELKQILKDSGYYNDPKALEKLGFRLISGRTHWKLEYADVRMPLSKTPSDYRANLNTAAEMAKRCF